jgi:hypothetical protein
MNKLVSGFLATTLAASFAVASIMPVNAAPVYVPQKASVSSNVQDVAWRGNDRVYIRNGRHYWRGHRGYREWHHGYRRHGDFWFPLAAFATGAIISGAIANDRPPAYGRSHEARCYARYRSYRAYDNTYQPYNGPRRQCTL